MQTTEVCTVKEGKGDGGRECKDTPFEKITCRDGYFCRINAQGGTACMERIDKLDTGGIIVSIIFGSAIVVAFGLMTFCSCKEKSAHKKLAAKMEAAAIAKASNVGKKTRNVSDRQPLMSPGATTPTGAGPAGAGGFDAQAPNPFGNQNQY